VRGWRVCLLALVAVCCGAQSAPAQSSESTAAAVSVRPWLVWHTQGFFSSCDGNCAFAIYGGRDITTDMRKAFLLRSPVAPWQWQGGNAGLLAGAFSRRFASVFDVLDFEAEAGVGQRFGDMHATELWSGVSIRWTAFPWNSYVRTTIAITEGINYATEIDAAERLMSDGHRASSVLNFFSPELTLALPSHPYEELLLRFHHRSGIFGAIHGVTGGAQFGTVGFRHRF
jgi:hypothetical protein